MPLVMVPAPCQESWLDIQLALLVRVGMRTCTESWRRARHYVSARGFLTVSSTGLENIVFVSYIDVCIMCMSSKVNALAYGPCPLSGELVAQSACSFGAGRNTHLC